MDPNLPKTWWNRTQRSPSDRTWNVVPMAFGICRRQIWGAYCLGWYTQIRSVAKCGFWLLVLLFVLNLKQADEQKNDHETWSGSLLVFKTSNYDYIKYDVPIYKMESASCRPKHTKAWRKKNLPEAIWLTFREQNATVTPKSWLYRCHEPRFLAKMNQHIAGRPNCPNPFHPTVYHDLPYEMRLV